jgi:hypothetical protein
MRASLVLGLALACLAAQVRLVKFNILSMS